MQTQKADRDDDDPKLSKFFERVEDLDSLSPDDFLERFERFGFLWFRGSRRINEASPRKIPRWKEILDFVQDHSLACETSWTVENYGTESKIARKSSSKISPASLSKYTGTNDSFYVSTIVHRKAPAKKGRNDEAVDGDDHRNAKGNVCSSSPSTATVSQAHTALTNLLPRYDSIFEDIYENGDPSGTWLFIGHHGVVVADTNKKRKRHDNERNPETRIMAGRAEHVDEVTHSGTYHIQISGTKTWKIRPHPDSILVDELGLANSDSKRKNWKLQITVEEGDVFVLNTKLWYHCTELAYTGDSRFSEWSISAAQDFYLPVPCPTNVAKGDVIYGPCIAFDDDDDDDNKSIRDEDVPEELPRSDNPNSMLVEVGLDDEDDSESDDNSRANTRIALVALRDIEQGESLTIAFEEEDQALSNANEQMDPRLISRKHWNPNEIVLKGEDRIPEDIPRSFEPNCELVEIPENDDGGCLALRALTHIPVGGVFCIQPDDDEDYEEVEVDLETGEVVK